MIAAATPIDRLGLSSRTAGALRLAGYQTFGQVAELSADQLRAIPHFSAACYEELVGVALGRTREPVVQRFVSRADMIARLQRAALWQANECQRLGDEWARAMAELELTTTRLANLAQGGAA